MLIIKIHLKNIFFGKIDWNDGPKPRLAEDTPYII